MMAVTRIIWTEKGVKVHDRGVEDVEILEFTGAKKNIAAKIVKKAKPNQPAEEIELRKERGKPAEEKRQVRERGVPTNRSPA